MNKVIIVAGIATAITVSGCGGGVEHESRTRIHVHSIGEPSPRPQVVEGQPINLHVHASGQSVCIEVSPD